LYKLRQFGITQTTKQCYKNEIEIKKQQ